MNPIWEALGDGGSNLGREARRSCINTVDVFLAWPCEFDEKGVLIRRNHPWYTMPVVEANRATGDEARRDN